MILRRGLFCWRLTWPHEQNAAHFGTCIRVHDGATVGVVVKHFDDRWNWAAYDAETNPRGIETDKALAKIAVERNARAMRKEPDFMYRANYKSASARMIEVVDDRL
ncbi:hypothetical protein D8780_01560 [Notoacmeibacter ruber]|uniref:Uncharacterized protein n=1 Tax=Notoacmeibacter ruber TaxID=2670375 RepID=A0A3L7J8U1_9HYPH|nr:hypothetical protein D8780_01560 [Notoacmeibacter ruber]